MSSPSPLPNDDSPARLLGDVVGGFSRLVRGEIALAKAEAEQSVQKTVTAGVQVLIGAVLAIVSLHVLAAAAVAAAVALGLSPLWASVAVGTALLLLAFGFIQYGLALLRPSNIAPRRTLRSLRQSAETLKTMVTDDANA